MTEIMSYFVPKKQKCLTDEKEVLPSPAAPDVDLVSSEEKLGYLKYRELTHLWTNNPIEDNACFWNLMRVDTEVFLFKQFRMDAWISVARCMEFLRLRSKGDLISKELLDEARRVVCRYPSQQTDLYTIAEYSKLIVKTANNITEVEPYRDIRFLRLSDVTEFSRDTPNFVSFNYPRDLCSILMRCAYDSVYREKITSQLARNANESNRLERKNAGVFTGDLAVHHTQTPNSVSYWETPLPILKRKL